MASKAFISVLRNRLHLHLLPTINKRPSNHPPTCVLPGHLTLRPLCTEPAGPDKSEQSLFDRNDASRGSTQTGTVGSSSLEDQSRSTEDTAVQKSLSKVKVSSGARKYFKQSWVNHQKSLTPDIDLGYNEDPDKFGTLTAAAGSDSKRDGGKLNDGRSPNERLNQLIPEDVDEPRDRRLNIPLTREGRIGKNAFYYTKKMSICGRQGKVREAINIFEHWMMLRDRVMPNKRTFIVLIGIVGRAGYTDKAFELYSQMRNLGLDAEDQVYTSLFNACANSPWPDKELKRAENLYSTLQDRGFPLNLITVKTAAKAMAFCGNFPRAFIIMEEASSRLSLDAECFDHLLMACVADKQSGFTRALQVWQRLKEFRVEPQTNTFNLMIRAARDCDVGDPDVLAKVLGLPSGESKLPYHAHLIDAKQHTEIESYTAGQLLLASDDTPKTELDRPTVSGENMKGGFQNSRAAPIDFLSRLTVSDEDQSRAEKQSGDSESHSNLYQTIPSFDRNMDEFLAQRSELHRREGAASTYEWWEEQPEVTQGQGKVTQCSGPSGVEEVPSTVRGVAAVGNLPTENSSDVQGISQVSSLGLEENRMLLRVKDIKAAHQRLMLLGGARRLVRHMVEAGAAPDVRTFSQLVKCLPDAEEAELDLLQLMEEVKVKPDVDLINDLMMKRNLRHSGHTVKQLLPLMSKLGLVPNMRTYSALALTCLKERDAHKLLADMKAANLEPSREVLSHFIYISRANFNYKFHMLLKMEQLGLDPMPETIRVIERSIALTKKNIIAAEKKDLNSFYLSKEYQESFQRFLRFYRDWLKRTSLHRDPHPWKAFQQPQKEKGNESDEEEIESGRA